MNRDELLDAAKATINGDRAHDYGSALLSFGRIADLWTAVLPVERALLPADVARAMVAMKLARLTHTPEHEDSWLDIAGYAALGAELVAPAGDDEEFGHA